MARPIRSRVNDRLEVSETPAPWNKPHFRFRHPASYTEAPLRGRRHRRRGERPPSLAVDARVPRSHTGRGKLTVRKEWRWLADSYPMRICLVADRLGAMSAL